MGGGLLETNNQLERFTKNKRSKKLTYSVLGILLIIGSITLFKTFAFFEEKQEFNVLKGKVPSHWYDMNLISVKVEGSEVESIPERGLYKTNVECTNGYGEWDYNSWSLKLTDLKENTKCHIEFTKNLSTEEYNKYIEAGISLRRNTYRGKDITSYYTDGSLYEMISNGTFDDIYVGDYIIAGGVTWLIADIDNYLYSGDTPLTKHHLTIIPAIPLMNVGMNDTETTIGGYYGSNMVQNILVNLVSEDGIIGKNFKNHLLEYRTILSTSVNKDANNSFGGNALGASNGWAWFSRKVDLMSEMNVYGGNITSSSFYDTGLDNQQYALFKIKSDLVYRYNTQHCIYWLKNVVNAKTFAIVNSAVADNGGASNVPIGVRPRFLIG